MKTPRIKCSKCGATIALTRQKLREAGITVPEDLRLKLRQRDREMSSIGRAVGTLSDKIHPGSAKQIGDTLESELINELKRYFPSDDFRSTRQKGADILHTIFDERHCEVGSIYWEAKRASTWSRNPSSRLTR